jgi:hypothetical protein
MAGHQVVGSIPSPPGQNLQQSHHVPNATNSSPEEQNCICPFEQTLGSQPVVHHHINRVEFATIDPVLPKKRGRETALQRGKAKVILAIPLKQKLDTTITEAADAIVENYRMGDRFTHSISSLSE